MADPEITRVRAQGRSPSFPFIPLQKAIEQARRFDRHSKGHAVRVASALEAWGYKPGSSGGLQTISALKAFGLAVDQGNNDERKVQITEFGRRLLKGPPASVMSDMLKDAALKPKLIREMWDAWGSQRPPRSDCIYTLTVDMSFTDAAASIFLNVYDATIAFSGSAGADSVSDADADLEADVSDDLEPTNRQTAAPQPAVRPLVSDDRGVRLMDGERELKRARVSEDAHFRLIVGGTRLGPRRWTSSSKNWKSPGR